MEIDPDCVPVALSSARQYLSAANFPGSVLDLIKLTVNRVLKGGSAEIGSHDVIVYPGAAHRPSRLDPRQQGARRSGLDPRLLHEPRHRPGRGGGCDRRAHRHAQGRAQRSRQADRRVPVRRLHRHGQDGACEDSGRISVRLGRPDDPPRHERVPDRRDHAQDPGRRRHRLAHQPRAQAALLRGPARRVREGARLDLGSLPAGVRRRPADGRHGARRRLPPLHHHPHDQPRRHQPPHLGARLRAHGGRLHGRPDHACDRPDLPPRVPEPARQGDRVPPADARPDARDPQEGAQPRAGAARPEVPRMGGGMGGLRAGLPAGEGLLGGDGSKAAEARHRSVSDRPARRHHRRAEVPGRRPVRLHPQRRPGDPDRVRRPQQRRGRQSVAGRQERYRDGRPPCRR